MAPVRELPDRRSGHDQAVLPKSLPITATARKDAGKVRRRVILRTSIHCQLRRREQPTTANPFAVSEGLFADKPVAPIIVRPTSPDRWFSTGLWEIVHYATPFIVIFVLIAQNQAMIGKV